MSGTSLDGIDVAVVDIRGAGMETVAAWTTPYSRKIREAILSVSDTTVHVGVVSRLNFALGELYAKAFLALDVSGVELIGCHGQTIFHENGNTLQIGEAAVLAERTGIPVVSNFRARDIAAGGKGAPLVPFFDYRMFRHPSRRRVALNIGGIANVTILPPGARLHDVVAFDTGPGNMVMDQLISAHNGRRFDRDGRIAASAAPDMLLLGQLLDDRYYAKRPPKTSGREQYGREFVARLRATGLPLPVLIATAALLTALTIARAIGPEPGDLIASGGGVHNRLLMSHLHGLLPHMRIATSADYGFDPDFKEAIAFALLAHETWRRRPSNMPGATGARRAVILGDLAR